VRSLVASTTPSATASTCQVRRRSRLSRSTSRSPGSATATVPASSGTAEPRSAAGSAAVENRTTAASVTRP
jgi:hypothetical protein